MKRIVKVMILVLVLSMLCGCGKVNTAKVADTNGDGKLTCTLEIRCDTLLTQLDKVPAEKVTLVPEDGIMLAATEVEFTGDQAVKACNQELHRVISVHPYFYMLNHMLQESFHLQLLLF